MTTLTFTDFTLSLLELSPDPFYLSERQDGITNNQEVLNDFLSKTNGSLYRQLCHYIEQKSSSHASHEEERKAKLKALKKNNIGDFDMTRISNRMITMAQCWKHRSEKLSFRNNIQDMYTFLETRYDKNYLIWNLSSHGVEELYSVFQHKVVNYQDFLSGEELTESTLNHLPFNLITLLSLCQAIMAWLKLDPKNVVITHCMNGRHRSGLVVSCLLKYAECFESTRESLDYFLLRRSPKDTSWVTQTMRRSLRYFQDSLLLKGMLPNADPLYLRQIILNTIPNFDPHGSCNPGLEIYQNGQLIYSSLLRSPSHQDQHEMNIVDYATVSNDDFILFNEEHSIVNMNKLQSSSLSGFNSTSSLTKFGSTSTCSDVIQDKYHIVFTFPTPIKLMGNLFLKVFHRSGVKEIGFKNVTMFSVYFHIGWMNSGIIRFKLHDLEIPLRDYESHNYYKGGGGGIKQKSHESTDRSRFDDEFSMDLVFIDKNNHKIDSSDHVTNSEELTEESTENFWFKETGILREFDILSQNLSVPPDVHFLRPLELQGVRKILARLALQITNNDIYEAHEFIKKFQSGSLFQELEKDLIKHGRVPVNDYQQNKLALSLNDISQPPVNLSFAKDHTKANLKSSLSTHSLSFGSENKKGGTLLASSAKLLKRRHAGKLNRAYSSLSVNPSSSMPERMMEYGMASSYQHEYDMMIGSQITSPTSSTAPLFTLTPSSSSWILSDHLSNDALPSAHLNNVEKFIHDKELKIKAKKKDRYYRGQKSVKRKDSESDAEIIDNDNSFSKSLSSSFFSSGSFENLSAEINGHLETPNAKSNNIITNSALSLFEDEKPLHGELEPSQVQTDLVHSSLSSLYPIAPTPPEVVNVHSHSPSLSTIKEPLPTAPLSLLETIRKTKKSDSDNEKKDHDKRFDEEIKEINTSTSIPPPPPLPPGLGGHQGLSPSHLSGSIDIPLPPPLPPPNGFPRAAPPSASTFKIKGRMVRNALHWQELPENQVSEDSVWSHLKNLSVDVSIDLQEFEKMFCIDPNLEKASQFNRLKQISNCSESSVSNILDIRRANNIAIGISKFYKRFDDEGLFNAITQNTGELNLEDLMNLKPLLPTPEERVLFQLNYKLHQNKVKEGIKNASSAVHIENFMTRMSHEPYIHWMVDALILKEQFNLEYDIIFSRLSLFIKTLESLATDENIKILLKVILSLGNLVTYDYGRKRQPMASTDSPSQGNQAAGFKMESLNKLKDVKSVQGKANLLNYLASILAKSNPDVLNLPSVYGSLLQESRNLDTALIMNSFNELQLNVTKVKLGPPGYKKLNENLITSADDKDDEVMVRFKRPSEVQAAESSKSAYMNRFTESLSGWLKSTETKLDALKGLNERFTRQWEKTANYFGDRSSDRKPEELIQTWDAFFKGLAEAHALNQKEAKLPKGGK